MSFMSVETRSKPRKVLRARTHLRAGAGRTLTGRSIDIGVDGMAVLFEEALPVGEVCALQVDTFAAGKAKHLQTQAKVTVCICSGTTGFRIGLQFMEADGRVAAFVDELP